MAREDLVFVLLSDMGRNLKNMGADAGAKRGGRRGTSRYEYRLLEEDIRNVIASY
jgi:hypothetical protein